MWSSGWGDESLTLGWVESGYLADISPIPINRRPTLTRTQLIEILSIIPQRRMSIQFVQPIERISRGGHVQNC